MALLNISALLAGNGAIASNTLLSGLQVWYKFEDTLTTDSSGNGHTGIFGGSPLPVLGPGKTGQGVVFSSQTGNGRIGVPGIAVASAISSFSVMGWVNTTLQSAILFGGRNSTNGNSILTLVTDYNGVNNGYTGAASICIRDDAGAGISIANGTTALNDGTWHHIAGVFDGSSGSGSQILRIFVDGAQQNFITAPLTTGITLDNIGANIGWEFFNGWGTAASFDDFRFYGRALSAAEIAAIFTLQAPASGLILNQRLTTRSSLVGTGSVTTTPIVLKGGVQQQITAQFAGTGVVSIASPIIRTHGNVIPISAVFAGAGAFVPTWYLIYPKSIHYPAQINISATFAGEGSLQVVVHESDVNMYMTTDPVNPGIYPLAGSDVLYRAAAGLEKAMSDVDAGRLIATYAELVRDQWDPWAISYRNLGFLAWASGVNLWEDDWSEQQRRQWVADQWTFKYYRGSDLGMKMAVEEVGAKLLKLIRPPAQFFPGSSLTPAERQAYVARFPQLRLYPYAPRPQLAWLNYLGGEIPDAQGNPKFVHNGRFFGPYRPFYPTNFNAGGLYLRKATYYDPRTGVETQLTVRTVVGVPVPGMPVTTYDEVQLPINPGNLFFPGTGNEQYLVPRGTALTITRRHAVVLGRLPFEAQRLIRVPRDGTLTTTQYQAIFQTVSPDLKPINVRPELVEQEHPIRSTELYCGQPLLRKFLPKTNAGLFFYERWYLFDPTRQPDQRWARTYMGRARFGIPKYSAIAKIDASFPWPSRSAYYGGFFGHGRFFAPRNTKRIDQVRRAVTAAMALRDTVLIDTKIKRRIQLRDVTLLDGTFKLGQWVTDLS